LEWNPFAGLDNFRILFEVISSLKNNW